LGIGGGSFGKVIGVVLLVVALPIFAAMGILSAAASAGIISMQEIIVQFMPLFGIGIAFSFLVGFGLISD
jgi:hypothetical protein